MKTKGSSREIITQMKKKESSQRRFGGGANRVGHKGSNKNLRIIKVQELLGFQRKLLSMEARY